MIGRPGRHVVRYTHNPVAGQILNDNEEVTQAIAELIRLHDGVLARVFALQTLLQDLGVLSPKQVQRRTDE
jgi:hypothetical protein